MRLVDLDEMEKDSFTGKTALMKGLGAYEKSHPINRLELNYKEYNITLYPKSESVVIEKK